MKTVVSAQLHPNDMCAHVGWADLVGQPWPLDRIRQLHTTTIGDTKLQQEQLRSHLPLPAGAIQGSTPTLIVTRKQRRGRFSRRCSIEWLQQASCMTHCVADCVLDALGSISHRLRHLARLLCCVVNGALCRLLCLHRGDNNVERVKGQFSKQ